MVITLQILVDESSDAHQIQQPDLCICYVNKKGRVAERFLGIVLVQDTTYLTLTTIIGFTFTDHSFRFSCFVGKGAIELAT
jgi:hypothetical protein